MTSSSRKGNRIISGDSRSKAGILMSLRSIYADIWAFRSHIGIVFGARFQAAYKGTGMGLIWNYALPLVPLTLYWFLSTIRIFPNFEGVDGSTFITFGVSLWFLLTGCIQVPIDILEGRNAESMKTEFPMSASIMSGFAQLLFDTLVRFTFVFLIIAVNQNWPMWQALFLPLLIAPGLLGLIGIGLILGILNIAYNDVSRVTRIFLQYGIFVSGVIFPLAEAGWLAKINTINPFSIYIDVCRDIFFQGILVDGVRYFATAFLSIIFFLVAVRVFYVMEYRVRGIS